MRVLEWILRIALFGEFLGHGYFAFVQSPNFVKLLTGATGFPEDTSLTLLRIIGVVDFGVAFLALAYPFRALAIYAAMWGLLTALSRPLSGMHLMDFVERWPNWGIPLALFFVLQMKVDTSKAVQATTVAR
ncbi:MAG: hypothetical protein KIT83_16505 [Bryobacterales bacterium]|nr:hypothetical protein [Bryobacterales bacterium]